MKKIANLCLLSIIGIIVISCSTEDVHDVNSVNISLNKTMLVLEEGANERLSVSFDPIDTPNQAHVWLSENTQVATVDETGLVTGISIGETTIIVRALDGGDTEACYVTVTERGISITLNKNNLKLDEGASERLSASFDPIDTPNKAHVWLSENPQVATVDETGLVTGISMGETTIIVKALDGGDTDTCYVTVTERSMPKSFAYGDTIHFIREWSSDQYGAHCLNYFIARGDTKCQWGPWDYDGGYLADSYSSGTYTYRVTGENTATLTSTNRQSISGRSWYMDIDMTFESYDKGTYECYEDPSAGNSHTLRGRFEISYNN